jgi:O-antigen/teichoic acid export membrane protein
MAAPANPIVQRQSLSGEIGTAVKHSFIYGVGGVLVKMVGFLLLPFYTHYLSPVDYGVLEVLDVTMSLLGMFLNMGITAALLRYYGAAQTEEERRKVVGTIFVFTVVTGLAVLFAGLAAVPAVSRLVLGPSIPATYLLLAFCCFVIGYIGNIPFAYLRAKEASGRVVLIDTLATVGILILSIVFLGGLKMAILGMLISPLIVGAIKLTVLIAWMRRDMTLGVDWGLLRRMLRFGAPLVFANLTMFTLNFSDRLFLQRLVSLDAVGVYAVGYKFGYLINFVLIQPFNMMWQARMYVVHRRPDHRLVFGQVFVLYSFLLTFAALGIALFSHEVVRIMVDPRYVAGEQVVGVVALGYVFLGIAYYVQLAMFLGDRTGLVGGVSTAAAALNLAANYILISRFGIMGAGLATLIGFLALAAGSYYCSERVMQLRLPVGRVLLGLSAAIAIYLAGQKFTPESIAAAISFKCVLLAGFAALLRFVLLSRAEIATVDQLAHSTAHAAARRLGWARA